MNNKPVRDETIGKIMGMLLRNPTESISLRQLALSTKQSYVTVHGLAPQLSKQGLIKMESKGHSTLISVNFEHASIDALCLASLQARKKVLQKYPQLLLIQRDIQEALAEDFCVLILFGSYAKSTPKKDSDYDIMFILPDKKEKIALKIAKSLKLYSKVHYLVASTEEFLEMLGQKYSVGREVFQHGVVLFGSEQYYALVKKYAREKGY